MTGTTGTQENSQSQPLEFGKEEKGKDLSGGYEVATVPNPPQKIAISKGQEYTPSRMQNERRFTPLFPMRYGLCSPKTSAAGGLHQRNVDLFPWFPRVT